MKCPHVWASVKIFQNTLSMKKFELFSSELFSSWVCSKTCTLDSSPGHSCFADCWYFGAVSRQKFELFFATQNVFFLALCKNITNCLHFSYQTKLSSFLLSPTELWENVPMPGGRGSLQLCLYGVCGHNIGKLTYPQTKAGLSISKNRPIPRLCTIKHELNYSRFYSVSRKPPIPR